MHRSHLSQNLVYCIPPVSVILLLLLLLLLAAVQVVESKFSLWCSIPRSLIFLIKGQAVQSVCLSSVLE